MGGVRQDGFFGERIDLDAAAARARIEAAFGGVEELFVPDDTQGRLAPMGSSAIEAGELETYICPGIEPDESDDLQRDS
ncbi:MAG: hypothetical protein H6799_01545 [Candidatus Nomurabacteria bacterium]|nr:MAG: hypothetical protein H6799_01545 [Candidatus Nomurabacteria bacterium]HRV75759.1 hypothetical protein [Candidatus Saccharimonadales bacterium]